MIKLLAFVASIISGAQVDAVYANHQLRGVLKDPLIPRRLEHPEEHYASECLHLTDGAGKEFTIYQYSTNMCDVPLPGQTSEVEEPVDGHIQAGAADAEICECYDICRADLCCAGDVTDPSECVDLEREPGCTWKPANEGQLCTDVPEVDEFVDPCREKRCTDDGTSGLCVWVAANDGYPCGDQTETECDKPNKCLGGYCQNNYEPQGTICTPEPDNGCTFAECNDAGSCVTGSLPDTTPCTTATGPLTFDVDCRKQECGAGDDAGTCVFKADDSLDNQQVCGDDASECQDADYCLGGMCEEGDSHIGDHCSICGVCSALGECDAVCGSGPKYDGLRFVVRYMDDYYSGDVLVGCGGVPSIPSIPSASLGGVPVYELDGVLSGCAVGNNNNLNNIEVKVPGGTSTFTPIHTSCSQPAANECMKFDEDEFDNAYSLYFVSGRVRGDGLFEEDFLPFDWASLDCESEQPPTCPPV